VKLHRCRFVKFKIGACWTVQEALDERGIEYEIVKEPTYPRGKRTNVIAHTGQHYLPAIEFEDGRWYREESKAMAETIRAGRLLEKAGVPIP
jgi:glutathione S-transferase